MECDDAKALRRKTRMTSDMKEQHVLFVCSQNRLRSPTAEKVFADFPGIKVASAGIDDNAEVELSLERLAWAHIIFVMEESHRKKICRKFRQHLENKRIICLNIPDDIEYMDPTLVGILKSKVPQFLDAA
jgi:predicted protein tyrosine phosphatase